MPVFLCTFSVWCLPSSIWCCPLVDIHMSRIRNDQKSWIRHNTLFSSFFSRWGPWSLHHHRDRWIVSPYEDGVMRINMMHIIVPKCKCFLNLPALLTEVQTCPWSQLSDCTSWWGKELESWTAAPHLLSSISKIQNLSKFYLLYLYLKYFLYSSSSTSCFVCFYAIH